MADYSTIAGILASGYTRYDKSLYTAMPGDYGTLETSLDPGAIYSQHPLSLKSSDSLISWDYAGDPGRSFAYSIPSVAESPFDVSPSDGDMPFEISGFLGGAAPPPMIALPAAVSSSDVIEGTVLTPTGASSVPWGLLLVVAVIAWAILAED